jgi:SecD/SecF fusion protein
VKSAAQWLTDAADELSKASASVGDSTGRFTLSSSKLTGEQLGALMRKALGDQIERDGIRWEERTAAFDAKAGQLTLDSFKAAIPRAVELARTASKHLGNARVQSVGEKSKDAKVGLSYEIATTETNREVVQAAIVATLSGKLQIQRAIHFTPVRDEGLTREPFFVIEANDEDLVDVIGGKVSHDIREFRNGVAVQLALDETAEPISAAEFDKRIREIALQPEFEQYRSRTTRVIGLGSGLTSVDGQETHRQFVVCAFDEGLLYEVNRDAWTEGLAKPTLKQIEAALSREKSLSQVIQFAPQIAGQTKSRAIFAAILAMLSIGAYVWFRFGTKDYGLAVLVCLVHDVAMVLGFVAISHYIHDTFLGRLLLIDDFKVDLTMVAAVLTIIGYSLNDTIVVFDRIRENRGKSGTLSANMINTSLNQTLSRTVLTSLTVFITVLMMYFVGGSGIHGFAYALLIGTISGTYSTLGIAVPLVYRPATLRAVSVIIAALIMIGVIFATTQNSVIQWMLAGLTLILCGLVWSKISRGPMRLAPRQTASV